VIKELVAQIVVVSSEQQLVVIREKVDKLNCQSSGLAVKEKGRY